MKQKEKIEKDYYTTLELVKQSWFPIRSIITLRKLIESGGIEAVDIGTTTYKRYRITNEAVKKFISVDNYHL